MGSDLDPVLRWELSHLAKLDLLDENEVVCELEDVMMGDSLGALVVTDLKVMFVKTGLIRRRTRVVSLPLVQIETVEAADTQNVFKRSQWAALAVSTRGPHRREEFVFDAIGSRERAEEIARTIQRQRDLLKPS